MPHVLLPLLLCAVVVFYFGNARHGQHLLFLHIYIYICRIELLDGAPTSRFGRTFGRGSRAYNSERTSGFEATWCIAFWIEALASTSGLTASCNFVLELLVSGLVAVLP